MLRGLAVAVAAISVGTGCMASSGADRPPPRDSSPSYVVGGTCPKERDAVRDSDVRPLRQGDVDGDGSADLISLVYDRDGTPRCRTFLVVDTGDTTYSVNVTVRDRSRRDPSTIAELVDLGGSGGVEIVLRQQVFGIESLRQYRIFTFHDDRLRPVEGPDSRVLADPFGYPAGATCTPGGLLVSEAVDPAPYTTWKVTRRYYELRGATLHEVRQQTGTVDIDEPIAGTFPEFEKPLFRAC
jgi:hypothetical protein